MAEVFALSTRSNSGTLDTAAIEIKASANVRPRLFEIGFIKTATGRQETGLGRPAAVGVTPTSPENFVASQDGVSPLTGETTAAIAWATGPTVPAAFIRRSTCTSGAGLGTIWTFPRGLAIPKSGALVLWTLSSTNGFVDVYAEIEET